MPSIPPPEAQAQLPEPGPRPPAHLPEETARGVDLPPWPPWTAAAAIAAGFGLGIVVTIFVDVGARASGSSITHPTAAVSLVGDFLFDAAFVAAAIYFAQLYKPIRLSDFGFRAVRWSTAVGGVLAAGLGYYVVTAIYASLLNLHGNEKLPIPVNNSRGALIGTTVFVCVVAPMAEEFFFRGFIFGGLRRMKVEIAGRQVGVWLAAIITGILFGLAHTGSASSRYLIPLGFLGFVLCLLRWRTGSLYPCMALHSINNSLAMGISQLHWATGEVLALIVGSLLVIGVITLPLGARAPAIA
jgi:membrane protease YdiL (CAAX protease family)